MIIDRPDQRQEVHDAHGGRGSLSIYGFFEGTTHPAIRFTDFIIEPGASLGYHQHTETEEIVYVVSGQLEAFHDGTCRVLAPGEAVLMRARQPHAYRNCGDEDLHVLAFFAAPGGEIDGEDLPMPEAISGWA